MTGMTWAEQELGDASLGDARLSRRLVKLATRLAESPSASIPQACRGWAEMRAAYRFLAQDKLDWQDMLQPHWDASAQRMREHPVVLCLQDTTELDFEGKATRGLGPLSYEAQRGLYLHPTYAVTPGRVPLGVIDAWMWAREFKDKDGQRGGLCESMRWIEGYERVAEQAKQMPGTRLVYVADREGDIVELMRRARELGHPADWLIRSKHDRSLGKGAGKLSAALQDAPVLGTIEFDMAARQGVQARRVRQQLRVLRTELADDQSGKVEVSVVLASEIDAPAGVKPVQWRLLTNRRVETPEQAVELIDWYRARWEIEILFHTLKNGCRIEQLQLDSFDKLERAIALYLVVSWRIGYLMRLSRDERACESPASEFFCPLECRLAYALHRKKPPARPKLKEVVRLIAMLGGFIGRKGDGEPGVKTLWQGMHDLRRAVEAAEILREVGELA
jgi:hypothetical protein